MPSRAGHMVWIRGRTYCPGTAEGYRACHAIMDKYELVPLSSSGKPSAPPAGPASTPRST
jgi:hypothetical protein